MYPWSANLEYGTFVELLKEFKFFNWRGEDFRDGLIGLFLLPTIVSHVINLA